MIYNLEIRTPQKKFLDKERHALNQRRFYLKNTEKIHTKRKSYYESNKERAKANSKVYYSLNRELYCFRTKQRRLKLQKWFKTLKSTLKCCVCGENDPVCLEFHHIDAKLKEINVIDAVNKGWAKSRILKEIMKCKVLCSNCHKKEHYSILFNEVHVA